MRCRGWSSGHWRATCDRRPRDRGYVTAETAVVIPALVLLLGMLLWGLGAIAVRTQCGDAARAGARAAARGEPSATVLGVARSAAPDGADVRVARDGGLYRVSVSAPTWGPGPLTLSVHGEAVAHAEPE
ncbi:TadE family type IV pilus minor pilin [Streptomyces litchfieldiae]|uniref:TadE family type IV pilus minor pilin n=1 Tax=Streptomyces litchfieldiae TaxID=3075543 RepID=A0ABU2MK78_9ACTN|nr:TadE family type IV pilus minor pilin [Streptomyces sp. DSM 44938]MDT0341881.1 TadE family type IV pilus minor pilin [Streptomyces sp. DSM 44938]